METQTNTGSIIYLDKEITAHKQFSVASLIYIAIAIMAVVYYFGMEDQGSSFGMLLLMLSFAFAVIGIMKIVSGKKVYVHKETKSPVIYKQLYFEGNDITKIRQMLENNQIELLTQQKQAPNGGARLDILLSKDGKYGSIQLFQYRSFVFEAISPVIKLEKEQIKALKID